MFETVAPEIFVKRSRLLLYESLPLSIGIHATVVGAIVLSALTRVTFPLQSPQMSASYQMIAAAPPPPPPPPPPPRSAPEPVVVPTEIVAPTVIPDVVPDLVQPPQVVSLTPLNQEDHGVEGGVEGGIEGGVVGGVVAFQPQTVGNGVLMDDGRVHFARDIPLPMVMERQDPPYYPEPARLARLEDDVVVRYIIGLDGRVREIVVLQHPQWKMFEESAVTALRTWRFKPLVVQGTAREVVHDLQIRFRLK